VPVLIHIYVTYMTVWRPVGGAVDSTEIHNSLGGGGARRLGELQSGQQLENFQCCRLRLGAERSLSRPLLFYQSHTKRRAAPAKRKI
jgi:hypothetical protein